MTRVAIVDDEPAARQRLNRLLAQHHPDVAVVVEADSGPSAIARLGETPVDLAFLDVRLPGGDGFDVVSALAGMGKRPPIVFVTAYDSYAVKAFEVAAVDYLLKPVEADRLAEAVTRFRETNRPAPDAEQLVALAERLMAAAAGGGNGSRPNYSDRLLIRKGGVQEFVAIDNVEWFESARNYVKVMTIDGVSHLIRSTLNQLEASLDPRRFVRIHRTSVVNLSRVARLEPWFSGDMVVTMASGTKLRLSRSHREAFYQVAGKPA